MDPVGAVAHDRTLADGGPIAPAHAGALIEEFADVALLPTCSLNMLAELLGNNDRVVSAVDRVIELVGAHLGCERLQYFLRIGGPFVHDLARRHGCPNC